MANITEYGFDKFLNRPTRVFSPVEDYLPTDEFDQMVSNISASKINQGQSTSLDGSMVIDYDRGSITFKQGGIVKAEIRKFLDDKVGLRAYSNTGTTIVDSTA